jgi:CIC family chloride channel protein
VDGPDPTRGGCSPGARGVAAVRRFVSQLQLYNFGRWLALASTTGVVTGVGAACLTWAIELVSSLALLRVVGFLPPGYGHPLATVWHPPLRPWLLLLVLPVGGLLVGWIITRFAPEAQGHGTDAVIHAFHRQRAVIRKRAAPARLIASALTIGSGGSAGREGPVAQVGAGFASFLADLFKLSTRDRRTLAVAGMAGGIGGMFRAPLGGALFAIEVLYSQNDFESEALIPSVISSTVSYVVINTLTGWEVIFNPPRIAFTRPQELLPYLLLGVVLSAVGVAYVKVFYWVRDGLFRRLPGPLWIHPAIGGLATGAIALVLPQITGGGYGWIQLTLDGRMPLVILAAMIPAKILATSLTIGSGGSGGVFAPSLIIGGTTGAVFAGVGHRLAPALMPDAAACVLVGMGGLFSGVANVPVASLVMVAEMSGSYRLLVPMMLVGSVTYLLCRNVGIYEQQVPGRVDSPAHLGEVEVSVLERVPVSALLGSRPLGAVRAALPYREVVRAISAADDDCLPIVDDDGKLIGLLTVDSVRTVATTPEVWPVLVAADLSTGTEAVPYLLPGDSLHRAARLLASAKLTALPVVQGPPPSPLLGVVTYRQILATYDEVIGQAREDDARS